MLYYRIFEFKKRFNIIISSSCLYNNNTTWNSLLISKIIKWENYSNNLQELYSNDINVSIN